MIRLAARRPRLVLALAFLLAAPAFYLASGLRLNTDLGRLLPKNSRAVLAKQELERATGDGGYFSILFEGDDPQALRRAVESTAPRVAALPGIQSVTYENPVEFLRKYRYLLVPSPHLQKLLDHVDELEARVNPLIEDLGGEEDGGDGAGGAPPDVEKAIERYLDLPERHQSPDGRLVGMIIRTEKSVTRLGEIRRLFLELEGVAAAGAREHGVWAGVGGSHRNKVDVYDQVRSDLGRSGTFAGLGILGVLILSFRSLRILPVVLLPLVVGLAWGYAFVPILVEDLNTITSFLLMVLFGTGVEYSIHLVKRFQAELLSHDAEAALLETFRSTGRSILTSGLATSLGLAILILSSFRGFSEFGIISAVGSLTIFAAMFTVLPPLLVLGARAGWVLPRRLPEGRRAFVPGAMPTVLLGAACLAGAALAAASLRFDYDFSRLQVESPATEAVKEKHRQVYPGFTVPGAIYVARDLPALDAALERLESRRRQPGSALAAFSSVRQFVPDSSELSLRRERLAELQERLRARWTDRVEDPRVRRWIADLRAFAPPAAAPGLGDLPPEILRQVTARDGSGAWMLSVDMAGRSRDGLQGMAFTRELYDLETPEGVRGPTGDKPILAEILWLVTREGPWLVGLTLLGVFALVLLDRRSLVESFWVLLPLLAGLALTVGAMVALGWKLNFFNIVVLPNLIGNAVDNGVHYFRRWRETGGDARATHQELVGPITTSVATTLMGYGGLLVAHHVGLRSIGALAALGLACCWLTGVVLMPGVLRMLQARGESPSSRSRASSDRLCVQRRAARGTFKARS